MSEQNEKWVPLAFFSNSPEAGMVSEFLRNNGIDNALQGANFGALEPLPLTGGFSEIKLLVPESELMKAQELYDAFFESETASLDDGAEVDHD